MLCPFSICDVELSEHHRACQTFLFKLTLSKGIYHTCVMYWYATSSGIQNITRNAHYEVTMFNRYFKPVVHDAVVWYTRT